MGSRGGLESANRSPGAFCVEFAGIPGAGKTTVAAALVRHMRAQGTLVQEAPASLQAASPRLRRLLSKGLAAAAVTTRHPRQTARVCQGVFRSHQSGGADAFGRCLQWLVAQHVLATCGSGRSMSVIDEGVLQFLWSTGIRGDVAPLLEVLSTHPGWRRPHLVVIVRTPPALAARRLELRPSRHSRSQRLSLDDRHLELQRGNDLFDSLLRWWTCAVGHGAIAVVEGDVDLDAIISPLAGRIDAASQATHG